MKVTYLAHSGFVAEDGDTALIFDYYRGTLPEFAEGTTLYVFSSHVHYDHFQKRIFEWEKQYSDIHYILSEDIEGRGRADRCRYVKADEEICLGKIRVRTLRSTDEGVAFIVYLKDKVIYHAGDLNWWHWEEEGEVYNEMMRRRYQHEIGKIEGVKIDAAFLPLDPRQEEQYAWGFDYFMRHTQTTHAFPMHMWRKYETCEKLLNDPVSEPYRDKVMRVKERQQVFYL
ncbi:MAG: MBL fold metallo-hydrolase [Dorea sp.]|nr:MBL fold metallo-hydrolase [Dorea sp.]